MIKKAITQHINRMTVLMAFGLCVFLGSAQVPLWQRLNNVFESQDMGKGLVLYQEISDAVFAQLPDSTKFDYHYLGAWVNSQNDDPKKNDHEKAITHLLEAKILAETSLGVYSARYMDVMYGLGEEYIELGQYEDALAIYQEGIVKTMYMRLSESQAFGNLIEGVAKCYEQMGWFEEIPNHLSDAWSFWSKDKEPFDSGNYFPLWRLYYFYNRYKKYDKALQINDKILEFISEKTNSNHPAIANMLYFRGCTYGDMDRNIEAIEAYRKALSILEINKLDTDELYGQIIGNLLYAIISTDRWEECDNILEDIKIYCGKINNFDLYFNSLVVATDRFYTKGNYNKALSLNTELLKLNLTENIRSIAEDQTTTIMFNKNVTDSLNILENQFHKLPEYSAEWFETGYKLSCAYHNAKKIDKNIPILKTIHDAIAKDEINGKDYVLWNLDNLYGIYLEKEDYSEALNYAIELYNHLDTIPGVPDEYLYNANNNICVAKLKLNHLDRIDEILENLKSYCLNRYGEISIQYATWLHNRGRAYQLQNKLEEAKQILLKSISIQNQIQRHPSDNTLKYYTEVEQKLSEL